MKILDRCCWRYVNVSWLTSGGRVRRRGRVWSRGRVRSRGRIRSRGRVGGARCCCGRHRCSTSGLHSLNLCWIYKSDIRRSCVFENRWFFRRFFRRSFEEINWFLRFALKKAKFLYNWSSSNDFFSNIRWSAATEIFNHVGVTNMGSMCYASDTMVLMRTK